MREVEYGSVLLVKSASSLCTSVARSLALACLAGALFPTEEVSADGMPPRVETHYIVQIAQSGPSMRGREVQKKLEEERRAKAAKETKRREAAKRAAETKRRATEAKHRKKIDAERRKRAAEKQVKHLPDVRGRYVGSGSTVRSNCQNPNNNGRLNSYAISITITEQSGASFSGWIIVTYNSNAEERGPLNGTLNLAGNVKGQFTLQLTVNGTKRRRSVGKFRGQIRGRVFSIKATFRIVGRNICNYNSTITARR